MQTPENKLRDYRASQGLPFSRDHEDLCRAVFGVHEHFSLPELAARFGGRLSEAEVHERLEEMIRAGLVRKIALGDERVYYEHVYGHVHHDHLVCVTCGRIEEFLSPTIERLQLEVSNRHGFAMLRHNLRIEGVCASCREKAPVDQWPTDVPVGGEFSEIPLTMLENGARAVITSLRCGRDPNCRIASMGLCEGEEIEVLQNTFTGPITVRHGETRLAVGHGLAHKIFARRLHAGERVRSAGINGATPPSAAWKQS
ncbi:MAG: FeoA domain-containing protein [Deltaproteobacteria bacterium]|nr:FeoA domain-containing protein [Deltaproteobacteria bacterium]